MPEPTETLHAPHGSTTPRKSKSATERKTITVDLTDAPEVYERIKDCAETDDRTISTWLRRFLIFQNTEGMLETPAPVSPAE